MLLNLDKKFIDDLTDKYIEFNLYQFETINKKYNMMTVDYYAMHAIHYFKTHGDMYVRPRLNLVERQAIFEISLRIAKNWDVMKMVFDDDKEYKQAIGKAPEWCKVLRKESIRAPRNYHDLTKVFWACESFMLACDDYYSV